MRFEDKIILVTGAGSGIGKATALRFAQEGAHIIIADINTDSAQETAEEVKALGQETLVVTADVSNEKDCERMIQEALQRYDHLDVVFSNAGIGGSTLVKDMKAQDWDRIIKVNLYGIFLTCKYSIHVLMKSKNGAIVNMASSMAGWDTSSEGAAYMASKEGVIGLTKSLALQLAGHGIRVNAVCPGIIKTNLGSRPGMDKVTRESRYSRFEKRIPLRRVGLPEDVAAAVAFLASEDARHITGSCLLIDGGQTLQSWSNAPEAETYPWFKNS